MPRLLLAVILTSTLLVLGGCGGSKLVPVNGVVHLDGKPVEGATVTFVADDGTNAFSGSTDASGSYTLQTGGIVGVPPGSYKILVVKSPNKLGAETLDPNSAEAIKMMKQEAEEAARANKSGSNGTKVMPGGVGVRSELPAWYGVITSTPFTARVESNGKPVTVDLELKSR